MKRAVRPRDYKVKAFGGIIGTDNPPKAGTNIQGKTNVRQATSSRYDTTTMAESVSSVDSPALELLDLHPLLVCDIEPDVRPFNWPKRSRPKNKRDIIQPNLFGDNAFMNSNPKLIDERPLVVIPSLARAVGLNQAVILQQIHFLLGLEDTGKVLSDGHKYVWNTYEEWVTKYFIFWKASSFKKHILNLEVEGLLLSKTIVNGIDKRKYYRINYEVLHARILEGQISEDYPPSDQKVTTVVTSDQKVTTVRPKSNDDGEELVCSIKEQRLHSETTAENTSLRSAQYHEQTQGNDRDRDRSLTLAREGDDDEFFAALSELDDGSGLELEHLDSPLSSSEQSEDFETGNLEAFNIVEQGPTDSASAKVSQPFLLPSLAPKGKKPSSGHYKLKASTSIPSEAFKLMYELCYMADTEAKQKTLDARQRGRVASALGRLQDTEAPLVRIRDFKKWWETTWYSGLQPPSRPDKSYQPPRPEQVVEHWHVATAYLDSLKPVELPAQDTTYDGSSLVEGMMSFARERRGL